MADTSTTLADTATQALRSIERVGTSSPAFDAHRDRLLACITELRTAEQALSSPALADVVAERVRQTSAEGWTAEHDDQHSDGALALAASCYARFAGGPMIMPGGPHAPMLWPFDSLRWKPTTPRRDRGKAAAVILAEIDRIDRAAAREVDNG